MQSEVKLRIRQTNIVSKIRLWYVFVALIILIILALNTVTAFLYNLNMSDFDNYFNELNEMVNIFVPIGFFHLQFSKFFVLESRPKLNGL